MQTKQRRIAVISAGVIALALPAAADGHVTLQPEQVPAGGFSRFDVRVPNERDDASTSKVEVEFPDGFAFVSYEPVAGWSTEVKTQKLDEPIEAEGEELTEQVSTVTWTADDPDAAIQPGQFRDFGLSVGLPADAPAGEALTFPAVQTYDNGEVVRWIGEPDSEEPAPVVALTAAEEEEHATADEEEATASEEDEGEEEGDDDFASKGLGIAALVLGGLGFLLGVGSLVRRR